MSTTDDRQTSRLTLSRQVLDWYNDDHTLVECAEEFGISYGKAHALLKEAGGTPRRRGGRKKPVAPAEVSDDYPYGKGNQGPGTGPDGERLI